MNGSQQINTISTATASLYESAKDLHEQDKFSRLPQDLIFQILSFLNFSELATCAKLNRKFYQLLANEYFLRTLFPTVRIFNASAWKAHFKIDITDFFLESGLKDVFYLKKYAQLLSVERDAGITLLTIPKDMTEEKLITYLKTSNPKFSLSVNSVEKIENTRTTEPVKATYRILITNNVLEGSRTLSETRRSELIDNLKCETPSVIEALALLVSGLVHSQDYLYSSHQTTYTYCEEKIEETPILVGRMSPIGVNIGTSRFYQADFGIVAKYRLY